MLQIPYEETIKCLDDLKPLSPWAEPAIEIIREEMEVDAGHDEMHLLRVARNALWFADTAGDPDVIIPAAILHDLVNLPKDSPRRNKASLLSADRAIALLEYHLKFKSFGHKFHIHHAIESHSYSANITPVDINAQAVQDADRLDALGLIGIARMFSVGGSLGRQLFHPADPTAKNRPLDESKYTLDHFYTKLVKLPDTMQTTRGRVAANYRVGVMLRFIETLVQENEGRVLALA